MALNEDSLAPILNRLAESPSDANNWESLYRLLWPYVLSTMYRALGGSRYLAEEGVQEVMLRLVRYLDFQSLERSSMSFLSYLRSTTHSVVIDLIRREMRHRSVSHEVDTGELAIENIPDWLPTPEQQIIARNALARALAGLKPKERHMAQLLAEGRTADEIAQITRLGKKTVYNTVSILRGKLRQLLFHDEKNEKIV